MDSTRITTASAASRSVISDLIRLTGGLWLLLILLLFYFLPTLKGMFRPDADLRRIALVNLFLGWTVIGWLVAIVMADGLTKPSRPDAKPFG
jgi:Superinfection immunity protein